MKKLSYALLMVFISFSAPGQDTTLANKKMEDYDFLLSQSKQKRTTAITLVSVGTVLMAGGFALGAKASEHLFSSESESQFAGGFILILGGLALDITSIFYFVDAHLLKDKAKLVLKESTGLMNGPNGNVQRLPQAQFTFSISIGR